MEILNMNTGDFLVTFNDLGLVEPADVTVSVALVDEVDKKAKNPILAILAFFLLNLGAIAAWLVAQKKRTVSAK